VGLEEEDMLYDIYAEESNHVFQTYTDARLEVQCERGYDLVARVYTAGREAADIAASSRRALQVTHQALLRQD
jgi:hypothetical protein